jgi:hypothetical protein
MGRTQAQTHLVETDNLEALPRGHEQLDQVLPLPLKNDIVSILSARNPWLSRTMTSLTEDGSLRRLVRHVRASASCSRTIRL